VLNVRIIRIIRKPQPVYESKKCINYSNEIHHDKYTSFLRKDVAAGDSNQTNFEGPGLPRPLTILQLEIMSRLYLLRLRRPTISQGDLACAMRITCVISLLLVYHDGYFTRDCNHGVTSLSVTQKQVEEIVRLS
jgi:hypothetical protein